ncbi:MAG: inositol-3-phosphate synthase [Nitrososphaerales archaeon]
MPSKKKKKKRTASYSIRVGVLGVGNVASVLVQSLGSKKIEGVWHPVIGGRKVSDIEIVAAFDIDRNKVGKDLSEAIFAAPNVSPKISPVHETGVTVQAGIHCGDVPPHLKESCVENNPGVANLLRDSRADIVLNLIPSGMQETSKAYAEVALSAGCSFVNATPATIACDSRLAKRFAKATLVLVGDDLMSQFGGTAFHKGILEFINSRGLKIGKSYQLDVGGGSETLNTIREEVKAAKRDIKSRAISAEVPHEFETVAGTTDYVDYMGNNRTSYFWISAKSFFGSETKVDVYLRTNDGTNAANVIFDVIRAVDKSKQRKAFGAPKEICDYGFKKLGKPTLLKEALTAFRAKYI